MNLEKIIQEYEEIRQQEKKEIKKADNKIMKALSELAIDCLTDFYVTMKWREYNPEKPELSTYDLFLRKIKNAQIHYNPEDITAFSLEAKELQYHFFFDRLGYFFSALIEHHQQKSNYTGEYVVITEGLEKQMIRLGFENKANVRIIGYGGVNSCAYMTEGTFIVDGNCGPVIGFCMKGGTVMIHGKSYGSAGTNMSGGSLTIDKDIMGKFGNHLENAKITCYGSVEGSVGHNMTSGTITVHGSVNETIGENMSGGKIFLNGTYSKLPERMYGGKIYHKGKCIDSVWKKRWRELFGRK